MTSSAGTGSIDANIEVKRILTVVRLMADSIWRAAKSGRAADLHF
jgi:hypothetical protein